MKGQKSALGSPYEPCTIRSLGPTVGVAVPEQRVFQNISARPADQLSLRGAWLSKLKRKVGQGSTMRRRWKAVKKDGAGRENRQACSLGRGNGRQHLESCRG